MKLHMRISPEKRFDLVGLVRGQVIENDVDLLVRVAAGNHVFEKTHELGTGMPLGGLTLGVNSRLDPVGNRYCADVSKSTIAQ